MSSVSLDPSRFVCPLCLQLLSDPVTVPCGHSFCRSCLSPLWSSGGSSSSSSSSSSRGQSSSCPQCRATFNPTPALGTNPLLQELVRDLRAVSLQHGSAAAPEKHRGHVSHENTFRNMIV
ncbi:hypothetical protein NL108_012701 [Boleophthalmus pectinirostris]|nr:hypothetical protein NL108_012701 [Boleophthalmus pectinirostris]